MMTRLRMVMGKEKIDIEVPASHYWASITCKWKSWNRLRIKTNRSDMEWSWRSLATAATIQTFKQPIRLWDVTKAFGSRSSPFAVWVSLLVIVKGWKVISIYYQNRASCHQSNTENITKCHRRIPLLNRLSRQRVHWLQWIRLTMDFRLLSNATLGIIFKDPAVLSVLMVTGPPRFYLNVFHRHASYRKWCMQFIKVAIALGCQ